MALTKYNVFVATRAVTIVTDSSNLLGRRLTNRGLSVVKLGTLPRHLGILGAVNALSLQTSIAESDVLVTSVAIAPIRSELWVVSAL